MVNYYDALRVGKHELKFCPENGCQYSSLNKSDLKDHINSRHIHYPFSKCEICQEKFFTRRNYNRHRKSRHQKELENENVENGKVRTEDSFAQPRVITPAINESTIFLGTVLFNFCTILYYIETQTFHFLFLSFPFLSFFFS